MLRPPGKIASVDQGCILSQSQYILTCGKYCHVFQRAYITFVSKRFVASTCVDMR